MAGRSNVITRLRESGDGDIKFPQGVGALRIRVDRVDAEGVWGVSELTCDCEEGIIAMMIKDLKLEAKRRLISRTFE